MVLKGYRYDGQMVKDFKITIDAIVGAPLAHTHRRLVKAPLAHTQRRSYRLVTGSLPAKKKESTVKL